MIADSDKSPTQQEVESQLQLIMSRNILSPQREQLLKYLVRMRLIDEDVDQHTIGYALFPDYVPHTTNKVRVMANHLRQKLVEYYDNEGIDDPVRIDLPGGEGYRPTFTFNGRLRAIQHFQRGLSRYRDARLHELQLEDAASEFTKAIECDSSYWPAYGMKAQTLMIRTLYPAFGDSWELGNEAFSLANHMLALNQNAVQGFIIRGAFYTVRFQWENAAAEFATALKIDPGKTRASWWYPAYLLAIGKSDKALAIVKKVAGESPGNIVAQALCGMFFYMTRDYRQAYSILDREVRAQHWLVNLAVALILVTIREPFFDDLFRRTPKMAYSGIKALRVPETTGSQNTNAVGSGGAYDFSAFGEYDLPSDRALSYLAVGDHKQAIGALRSSRMQSESFMTWLHIWPLLDPLREYEEFQQLIRDMNLPPSATF